MAIKSIKLGPGTLTFSAVDAGAFGDVDLSSQVRACTIKATEKVEKSETILVLSGEELGGDESTTYDWIISGILLQDIEDMGAIEWSWLSKGLPHTFDFEPVNALSRHVSGIAIVSPLELGGVVDKTKRLETPFSFRLVGDPLLNG